VVLSQSESTTIIITTHYIEEARTASKVGFMRSGRLLAEESPEELLISHCLNTLEAVFLKLSQLEDENMSKNTLTLIRKSIQNQNEIIIDNNIKYLLT